MFLVIKFQEKNTLKKTKVKKIKNFLQKLSKLKKLYLTVQKRIHLLNKSKIL